MGNHEDDNHSRRNIENSTCDPACAQEDDQKPLILAKLPTQSDSVDLPSVGSSNPVSEQDKHVTTYEEIYKTCEKAPWYCIHKRLQYVFRAIVSQNRRRTNLLDLSLITPRVVAMGFPAREGGLDGQVRNPIPAITEYLKRYTSQCRIYNLKGGKPYESADFPQGVVFYEMADHEPPRFEYMFHFVQDVIRHLEKPDGAVAVHCKAGKGRTGVMICAYLYEIGFYRNPRQVLDFYGIARTVNNQGLTIPSQRRYVYYYAHLKNNKKEYKKHVVQLVGIYFEHIPPPNLPMFGEINLKLDVTSAGVSQFRGSAQFSTDDVRHNKQFWASNDPNLMTVYDPYKPKNSVENQNLDVLSHRCYGWTVPKDEPVFLEGDVCISLRKGNTLRKGRLGEIFFNTQFHCEQAAGAHYCHGDMEYKYEEGRTSLSTATVNSTAENIIMPDDEAWESHLGKWFPVDDLRKVVNHHKDLIVEAHNNGNVKDKYNDERKRLSTMPIKRDGNRVVDSCPETRPNNATTPLKLKLGPHENVQAYETCEIDYAAKHHTLPSHFKVFVVTKCVVDEDKTQYECASRYIQALRASQDAKRELKYRAIREVNDELRKCGEKHAQTLACEEVDSESMRNLREPFPFHQSCHRIEENDLLSFTEEEQQKFEKHVAKLK